MIEDANKILRDMGSNFRTIDGVSICMYSGHLMFLKKTFGSSDELLAFVRSASVSAEKI